ncbi:hypothetical protein E8E13_001059 [Curvularia kusanoi]|uniref:Uncharacterized protein n=1 Tax=Curvularia kusanoi TaxID=90978 RepID=A0A9P4T317_CURKU|nr:hypothetical protein E8E13_001059 [Curvularia kusanoi]
MVRRRVPAADQPGYRAVQQRSLAAPEQSQSIDPLYLLTVAGPTPGNASRRKSIDRKNSYTTNKGKIGHTLDAFTKRTALFSGFAIKPASSIPAKAELQISICSAASIYKKQELVRCAELSFDPAALVKPRFTIVRREHHVYNYYLRNNLVAGRSKVHVLGPDLFRFEGLSTNSVRDIFRLLRLYGNVLRYEADKEGY